MTALDRHGEYKVPGGKLVVVDLKVIDGIVRQVEISGDFFLEPPSALESIIAAVIGAPADAQVDELSGRIAERLDEGVEMIGFSPEAVARAVSRALS